MSMEYLKIDELLDGATYLIDARNASFGIWDFEENRFHISRHKFGMNRLDMELHWDSDDKYGTAKPIKLISDTHMVHKRPDEVLKYLNALTDAYQAGKDGLGEPRKMRCPFCLNDAQVAPGESLERECEECGEHVTLTDAELF